MGFDLYWHSPKRLLAGAMALFAAIASMATCAQANVSPYGGLYVVAPAQPQPSSPSVASALYADTDSDGIYLPIVWGVIEPALNVYDWRTVDAAVQAAVARNQKIEIGVSANQLVVNTTSSGEETYSSPTWLFSEGVHSVHFVAAPQDGLATCDKETLAPPWVAAYEQPFTAMIAALAAHLKTIPGGYQAVSVVKITGINGITGETGLPAQTGPMPDDACQTISDAVTAWQAQGYTPIKIINAWKIFAAAFAQAFPDKLLADEVLAEDAFPPIDNSGTIVTLASPTYVDVSQQIVAMGQRMFPGRFAVQWNGPIILSTTAP